MRYLGIYPTERALSAEILPVLQGTEAGAPIAYDRFEEKALELLASRAWDPDPDDVLLQAFKALDENGVGYIEATRMRELLLTKGTPFRDKEVESFMSVAKDLETGHIYYEDYVAMLSLGGTTQ
jgi:calmodulin